MQGNLYFVKNAYSLFLVFLFNSSKLKLQNIEEKRKEDHCLNSLKNETSKIPRELLLIMQIFCIYLYMIISVITSQE